MSHGPARSTHAASGREPREPKGDRPRADPEAAGVSEADRSRFASALQESEERFRQLADAMPQLVWTADPDGRVDYYNERWREYGGILPTVEDGGLWWSWAPCLHPDDVTATVDAWQRAVRTGDAYQVEHRVRMADGRIRWHLSRGIPRRDPEGRIVKWYGTATDIHDFRVAKETARANEERYRLVARATNEVIWDWDLRTNRIEWNDTTLEIFGCAAEELGTSIDRWCERVHPDERERVMAGIRRAIASDQESWSDEYRFLRKDGSYGIFLDRGHIARDQAGQAHRMIGSMLEITERRRVEGELRESEARFRALADNIAQFAWMADEKGDIFWFNRRWFDYTGTTLAEAGGSGWQRVQHPDFVDRVTEGFRRRIERGEPWEDTFPLRGKDGAYRWFLSRAVPIRDQAGEVTRWFGTNTDVTDRRVAEEALRLAKEAAERASSAKDAFLAALSHELRTPLTPVLMVTQMLENETGFSEEVRRDLRMIHRNVELEIRLIDDLLDLTRITRGKLQMHSELFDLHQVVRDAVQIGCDDIFSRKGLKVVFDLAATDMNMWGDVARLGQVFWNLIKNAVKFTPAGGTITLRSWNPAPGQIEVSVEDTGQGIEPEALPYIFGAFEQGGVHITRQFGGLGLGLAICRAVTELHGGRIMAQSKGRGHGAKFVVVLPTHVEPAESGDAQSSARPSAESGPAEPVRRTILLVEDHEHSANAIARLLGRAGHDVRIAGTVKAAMHLAASERFDLLVSDLGLPDGSGNDLMRELRKLYGLRGIALSGFGMEEDLARSREAGFEAHLVKPVRMQQLLKIIQDIPAASER